MRAGDRDALREPGWLFSLSRVGGRGEAGSGAELAARRAVPRPLGKWMLCGSAGAGGGESTRSAARWPRPGPGRSAGPPPSSLTGAGLSREPRNGAGPELPVWFLGGGSLRRNMALVGNGADLEADEVLAGAGAGTVSGVPEG